MMVSVEGIHESMDYISRVINELGAKASDVLNVGSGHFEIKVDGELIHTLDKSEHVGATYHLDVENDIVARKYKVILLLNVLEHTTNPGRVLENIYCMLEYNGAFIISVPLHMNYHLHPDYYRFIEEGIQSLICDKGFRKIRSEKYIVSDGGEYYRGVYSK